MRVLDLFSGIGGFSLGLEACGMTTAAFCERDEFCTKILNKHWPDVPVHSDVRKLDGTKYAGSIDVVCGGFPCQPFSVAGQQRGKDDDRHLWPEMLRVISESKPRWVIGENVSGFVRMALDDVSLDLENEGYTVRTFVLPACAADAKHRRDRVFIVGYASSKHRGRRANGRRESGLEMGKDLLAQTRREQVSNSTGRSSEDEYVANATSPRSEAGLPRQESRKERHTRKPDHEGNQRLGWETGGDWATEPAVGRVADGVPNRVDRIKSLGNAVVPQLIQIIGELVLAADKEMNHE
tara:strand:+ start:69 stop:953 length:885 start_codon:yes stop_codon:yes gene_type:complete